MQRSITKLAALGTTIVSKLCLRNYIFNLQKFSDDGSSVVNDFGEISRPVAKLKYADFGIAIAEKLVLDVF